MDEAQILHLAKEVAKEAANEVATEVAREAGAEGAKKAMQAFGIDTDNPLEVQKDQHFLRDLRNGTNKVKTRFVLAIASAAGLAAAVKFWPSVKG
ncbi:conserved hypothetical protein [Roseibium sp. TrichSKD4]|nr:conserved hypothetical protein [Roseibium sp. TrichSKD4]